MTYVLAGAAKLLSRVFLALLLSSPGGSAGVRCGALPSGLSSGLGVLQEHAGSVGALVDLGFEGFSVSRNGVPGLIVRRAWGGVSGLCPVLVTRTHGGEWSISRQKDSPKYAATRHGGARLAVWRPSGTGPLAQAAPDSVSTAPADAGKAGTSSEAPRESEPAGVGNKGKPRTPGEGSADVNEGSAEATTGSSRATTGTARGSKGKAAPASQMSEEGNEGTGSEGESGEEGVGKDSLTRAIVPQVSFGGSEVMIPAGEYHPHDLVCIGGTVDVRGEVRGTIVVVGGVLTVSGTVRQDVIAVASRVRLEDGARVGGELVNVAGHLDRAPNVKVRGEFTSIEFPNLGRFATGRGVFRYLLLLLFWFGILATAIRFLGILVVAAVASSRVEGALAPPQPSWVLAFFLGLLVHFFAIVLTIILFLLCVTLPLVPVLAISVRIATWMGLASIYLQVGRNVGRTVLGRPFSYFGSILAGFALFAIIGLVPIFGWVFSGLVSCTALGLMLLTRFGGKRQPAASVLVPPVPAPFVPAPPVP